jgi:hypothetical protein
VINNAMQSKRYTSSSSSSSSPPLPPPPLPFYAKEIQQKLTLPLTAPLPFKCVVDEEELEKITSPLSH